MKIAFFGTKNYEKNAFVYANKNQHDVLFLTESLSLETVSKANGYESICCFVTDRVDQEVIEKLAYQGTQLIALRSAGYDHVDLSAAKTNNITVVRVPSYSPESIAEFTVGLILVLSRKILTAYRQGLDFNFSLENLIGTNLFQKTVGIIGTGKIGTAFAKIINGFGCRIIAYDPVQNETCHQLNVKYVELNTLLQESDIVSLHCLLNEDTYHILDKSKLSQMKKGAILINTGRGALINTVDLLESLEQGHLGYAGLDVYEKEKGLFFMDRQGETIHDQLFLQLQALPNVIITPHQAFLTEESIANIATTTIDNITAFEQGKTRNQVG